MLLTKIYLYKTRSDLCTFILYSGRSVRFKRSERLRYGRQVLEFGKILEVREVLIAESPEGSVSSM